MTDSTASYSFSDLTFSNVVAASTGHYIYAILPTPPESDTDIPAIWTSLLHNDYVIDYYDGYFMLEYADGSPTVNAYQFLDHSFIGTKYTSPNPNGSYFSPFGELAATQTPYVFILYNDTVPLTTVVTIKTDTLLRCVGKSDYTMTDGEYDVTASRAVSADPIYPMMSLNSTMTTGRSKSAKYWHLLSVL